MSSRRYLSSALFGAIVASFFLPFGTVSCDGAETTATGMQLVTMTVPEGGEVDGEEFAKRVEREGSFLAIAGFAAAALGCFLGLRDRPGGGWCAATGLIATVLLAHESFEPFGAEVTYHAGYWLALGLFTAACFVELARRLRRRWRPSAATASSSSPQTASET